MFSKTALDRLEWKPGQVTIVGPTQLAEPRAGEDESAFMKRCVPMMIDEGNEQDKAVAMCSSMWSKGAKS